MKKMKDVVIGCITNYTFEKIKLFVNSIDRSGFTGHKVMIVYNVPKSTVDELQNRGGRKHVSIDIQWLPISLPSHIRRLRIRERTCKIA
jgi:hypothetical protein